MEGREGNSGDDIRMELMEMVVYMGRWGKLAQDRVEWRALVVAVLNLRAVLPCSLRDVRMRVILRNFLK
jgi:hypothetical protein